MNWRTLRTSYNEMTMRKNIDTTYILSLKVRSMRRRINSEETRFFKTIRRYGVQNK